MGRNCLVCGYGFHKSPGSVSDTTNIPKKWASALIIVDAESPRLFAFACAMCRRLLFVSLVLAVLCNPDQARAQFTDPRTYDNTPVASASWSWPTTMRTQMPL